MPRKPSVATLLTLTIVFAALAYSQEIASPPRDNSPQPGTPTNGQHHPGTAGTVTAIVVKSWGNNPVWADLNQNWSTYGKIAVSIDYTTLIQSDFTYQDLVNSKANVVILSDPAGGIQQYSSAEISAIAEYAKHGHPVLATYATFQYSSVDNRGLAPIFGLSSTLDYTTAAISNSFSRVKCSCLLRKIPGTWQSNGYNYSQVPSSGSWQGDLGGVRGVADSDNYVGVITVHSTPSYTAAYISNMPEYQTVGGDDEQLLYNAITCYVRSTN